MPRAGGVYSLPAGNPVGTLTVISSSWANTTMSDIATALTGSLPTDGSAPMSGPLRLVDGTSGAPGLTWASEATSGWYRIGLNQFGFSVSANSALTVSATRGWTIPTPGAATVGLTINAAANTAGLSIIGQAGSNAILALRDGQAGTTLWSLSVGVGAVGEFDVINNTAGTTPFKIGATGNITLGGVTISSAGNVVIPAPTAGVALAVAGFAGANLAVLGGLVVATAGNVTIAAPTAGVALTVTGFAGANLAVLGGLVVATAGNVTVAAPTAGNSLAVTQNAAANQAILAVGAPGGFGGIGIQDGQAGTRIWNLLSGFGSAGTFSIFDATAGTARLTISTAGAVVINAPTAATTLSITGAAGSATAFFQSSTTASNAFGLLVNGGTNTNDFALRVVNAANSVEYAQIHGDGGLTLGAPTGGDQGLGTLNATSIFVNGVVVGTIPANYMAAALTKTSDTTFATALTVTLPVGAYKLSALLQFSELSVGSGGIKFQVIGGSATVSFAGLFGAANGTVNGAVTNTVTSNAMSFATIGVAVNADFLKWDVMLTVTVAGTVLLQWAQNSSSAQVTTLSQGCSMVATKVG